MSGTSLRCSLRFPPSTLPKHLRGRFLSCSSQDFLRNIGGKKALQETRISLYVNSSLHALKESLPLEGDEILLVVEGTHALDVMNCLQDFVKQLLSRLVFDEDGFCQIRQDTKALEAPAS